jgi:hypothetical protein
VCTSCGTATTVLVIIEYIQGPTATSTTIKLVPSLELPAITVCPKVPDAFDFDKIFNDIKGLLPEFNKEMATDLIRFWLGWIYSRLFFKKWSMLTLRLNPKNF